MHGIFPLVDFCRNVATNSQPDWSVSNVWFLIFYEENQRATDLEFRLLFWSGFGESLQGEAAGLDLDETSPSLL